jgi:hypothetical protein
VTELLGPNYGENCERRFPATGYANVEAPGDPKVLACAHPLEYENEPAGCQVRDCLLVNAPILNWLRYWCLTIGQLVVGAAEGGAGMADSSNLRMWAVLIVPTTIRSVTSVVKAVSMQVVDQSPVERRCSARRRVYDAN